MAKKVAIVFSYTAFIVAIFYFLNVLGIAVLWYFVSIPLIVGAFSLKRLKPGYVFFVTLFGVVISHATDAQLLKVKTWVEAVLLGTSGLSFYTKKPLKYLLPGLPAFVFSVLYFSPLSGIVNYCITTLIIFLILKEGKGDG